LVNIAQGAAKGFNLPLVTQFLALGEFHEFQYIFHLIYRALEGVNDFHHFVNGLADGRTMMGGFGNGGTVDGDAFCQAVNAMEQGLRFWRGGRRKCRCGRLPRCFGSDVLGLWRRVRTGGWWRLSSDGPRFGFTPAPTTASAAMATTIAVGGLRGGNCGWTRNWCFALGHAGRACEEPD
jgi:hypothetical protein